MVRTSDQQGTEPYELLVIRGRGDQLIPPSFEARAKLAVVIAEGGAVLSLVAAKGSELGDQASILSDWYEEDNGVGA
jgi:hypothetical protein